MNEISSPQDSARYPLFSLANAIEVGQAVLDCGGANVDVPKASIAHALNASETSGGFLQRLLTARVFGIIEGRGQYRLTEVANHYFSPLEEGAREKAYVEFISRPPVFAELIKKFDGQKVPAVNLLANILERELGVAKSWKDRVATNFIKTTQAVGVLDGGGFLRYRASRHAMTSTARPLAPSAPEVPLPHVEPSAQATLVAAPPKSAPAGRFAMTIPYGDTFAYLESPQRDKLDSELWEMLNAAVQMLKPRT